MAIKAGQLKERADYQAYILEMLRRKTAIRCAPLPLTIPLRPGCRAVVFLFRSNPAG